MSTNDSAPEFSCEMILLDDANIGIPVWKIRFGTATNTVTPAAAFKFSLKYSF